MTFTEFRNNETLRGWADHLNKSPEWLTLLDVILKEQHPMHWQISENTESPASRQLGRIEGFNHAIAVIAKAGRKPAADPIRQIPVTFLTPTKPTKQTEPKPSHARKH